MEEKMEIMETNEDNQEAEVIQLYPETEEMETEDSDLLKGIGIGTLIGAAVMYGGSKIVKRLKNRKKKKKTKSFIDKVKDKVEEMKAADEEFLEEDDFTEETDNNKEEA